MADSSGSNGTPDTIATSQAQKEVTANEFLKAASRAADFGNRYSTTTGLTWGIYGTPRWHINATATARANFTIALTGSSTRYVSVDRSLNAVQVATTFDADKLALYSVVTGTSTISSYSDLRDPHHIVRFLYGRVVIAMGGANKTLTYEQAMCESIELTGSSGSLLDVIVPTVPRAYTIYANTTGGGGIRVKTSAGSGVTIADTRRAIVECDGTNVVRITADV